MDTMRLGVMDTIRLGVSRPARAAAPMARRHIDCSRCILGTRRARPNIIAPWGGTNRTRAPRPAARTIAKNGRLPTGDSSGWPPLCERRPPRELRRLLRIFLRIEVEHGMARQADPFEKLAKMQVRLARLFAD